MVGEVATGDCPPTLNGRPDEDGDKKKKEGLDQSDDLRYQIVIDCESESQQKSMLDRFEKEGIRCGPLIS